MFMAKLSNLYYEAPPLWLTWTPEQQKQFLALFKDFKRKEDGTLDAHYGEVIADDCDITWLLDNGFKRVEITRIKGLTGPTGWLRNHAEVADAAVSTVHIHVPNIGLLSIDEVDWIEDACTQELQSRLNDGWRILAVCPPNSTRRPDYILGRTRSESQ